MRIKIVAMGDAGQTHFERSVELAETSNLDGITLKKTAERAIRELEIVLRRNNGILKNNQK